jgi:transcription elongation factor S-II
MGLPNGTHTREMPGADVREKVVGRLTRVVTLSGHDTKDPVAIAKAIEKSLFNRVLETCIDDSIPRYWENSRFMYRYTTRALSLEFNLKNPKNPTLLKKVMSGKILSKNLVRMSPMQLFPALYEDVYERIAVQQLRRMAPTHANAPDGAYTCRKCKSKKTVYTSIQIRSADEPMTTFVTCLGCGNRWKD